MTKRINLLLAALLLFSGCTPVPAQTIGQTTIQTTVPIATTAPTEPAPDPAEVLVDALTLEQQIGQMFLLRCPETDVESLVTQYQFGGLILFNRDVQGQTPETLAAKIESYQLCAEIPMIISVDEEGGSVTRISNHSAFREARFPSPRNAYADGGLENLLNVETEKARLLRSLGINMNLAPVCDVVTDPGAFLYDRALGLGPEETGSCIAAMVQTMADHGVGAVLKHFPGYGNCADTHVGSAFDDRTMEEFRAVDFLPFRAGFESGAGAVMVCHNVVNCMDPELPASLSPEVHRILRDELQFDGVIITDDLVMDAISGTYGEGEAAVLAVIAGNDMLCTSGYEVQFQAILDAVADGRITPEQIRRSALRIIRWKMCLGLM